MAPEAVQRKEVTFSADLWPVGCILHEIITGKLTYPGKTDEEIERNVLERLPSRLTKFYPSVFFNVRALKLKLDKG